ncbi:hypothetical protein BJY00DRAFT_309819 [Aspergillus carlsbadensis]|nr:hypothetical protein BJY00DRAFT_309819 [Aspergillus carlsbadensis]
MAEPPTSRIPSPGPDRESRHAERSDNQPAQASPPALADVQRPASKERKRKAIEPPGSPTGPPGSTGRSSSIEARPSGGCVPEVAEAEQLASGASADYPGDAIVGPGSSSDRDGDGDGDGDGETGQRIPSAESSGQRHWPDFDDIGFRYIPPTEPTEPSTAAPRGECVLTLARAGHRARNGVLRAAYVAFAADESEYIVAFDAPDDDDQTPDRRTLAHECIDLFVNEEYDGLESLLKPLVQPLAAAAAAAPKTPSAGNFEAFLSRAEIHLRLVPGTTTLEPYPAFRLQRMPEPIDWDFVQQRVTDLGGRVCQFSDVEHFRPLTKRVYEVTVDGEAVIYKKANTFYSIRREITGLQVSAHLKTRAPRLVGLIGAGTEWGGLLMTSVPASYDLSDLKAPVDCSEDSPPRLQATTAECTQWFEDISAAIHGLHRYDWAYGDVKPGNVLIDDDRHAWLIDFEGSFTPDWVDESLADTIPGDLQGLERLRQYLGLEDGAKDEPQTNQAKENTDSLAPVPTLTRSKDCKRKASEPLDSPPDSKKQPGPLKGRASDNCDQEEKQQQQQKAGPSANETKSADDQAPTASNPGAEHAMPSTEASESASGPASQKHWADWVDLRIVDTFVPLSSPAFPDVSATEVVRAGWRANQGVLDFAYVSFRVHKTTYSFLLENLGEEGVQGLDRQITHRCIDLFIKKEYAKVIEEVVPLAQRWFRPDPETFEAFLPDREIGVKLVPSPEANAVIVGRLGGFLEDPRPIDWECFRRRVRDCGRKIHELSEVTDFQQLEARIFEVTIGGETMIYKQALDLDNICREIDGLLVAQDRGIRAPRLRGVIGADTAWGGVLMTKVPAIGNLHTCIGDSRAERQQWYDEVSAAIRGFHEVGCAYGDVKAGNVLIDEDRRPWLIDFEGGTTEGYVDLELKNTIEGDLQGLEVLRKWLDLEDEAKDEPQPPA